MGVGWRVGGGGAESTDLKKLIQKEARRNEATCYLQPNLNLRTWAGGLNWSVLDQQANPSYILGSSGRWIGAHLKEPSYQQKRVPESTGNK